MGQPGLPAATGVRTAMTSVEDLVAGIARSRQEEPATGRAFSVKP
jgi:hypothetical protein